MRLTKVVALAGLAVALLCGSGAQAAPLQWQIDTAQSSVKLAIPDHKLIMEGTVATLRVRNQNNTTWTTNVAPLAGSINTDYVDGVQIQFLNNPLGQIVGVNTGNYRPNPAAFDPNATNVDNPNGQFTNTSSGPAVMGFRLNPVFLGGLVVTELALGSFSDMSFDMVSTTRALNGAGQFGIAGEMNFGISQATLAMDGLSSLLGQPVPDALHTVAMVDANTAASGSITSPDPINQPWLRRLQLPINVPTSIEFNGVPFIATLSGTVVAYAMVPEPSSALLAGLGAAGLFVLGYRRRKR